MFLRSATSRAVRVAVLILLVGVVLTPVGLARPGGLSSSPAAPSAMTHISSTFGYRSSAASAPTGATATAARILEAVHHGGAPRWATYLPNLGAIGPHPRPAGHIVPLYRSAPAPMGLSDVGLRSGGGGALVPYLLNSSSINGSIRIANASPFYVDASGPYGFGIQLNTVVTNVTLFGNSTNTFWTQNVVQYASDSHQLTFIDNIWNFSSLSGVLPPESIRSGNGTVVGSTYYFVVGPTFTVGMPFTLNLSTTTGRVGGDDAVWFNYTLINASGGIRSGSYDRVVFASGGATTGGAHYEINGENYSPIGLPYDAELVLGGPGGGSTQDFQSFSSTLGLTYWNATSQRYVTVPTAEGYGTDTGETVSGVTSGYTLTGPNPIAMLAAGPSYLIPLWGDGGLPGSLRFAGSIAPTNAWLFLTNGTTYNSTDAQWAPLPTNGNFAFNLSLYFAGYAARFELSDYRSVTLALTSPTTVSTALVRDTSWGVYTPLTAWSNSELAAIATSGNGSSANPYLLDANEYGALAPEFSGLNDFWFPVFYGLLLASTSAHVALDPAPSFRVYFNAEMTNVSALALAGLPLWNDLQLELYNATNVSLLNTTGITGWATANADLYFPLANLVLWNSSDILVAGDAFISMGASVIVYGGNAETFWGNSFGPDPLPLGPAFFDFPFASGLTLFASGDLVADNYFAASLPVPASTPSYDLYSGGPAVYADRWNVTPSPAATVRVVNGVPLSGNILGGPEEGGNYWWGYGLPASPYGALPYTDGGSISVGGDFAPLTPPLYRVTFSASGLPTGTPWSVVLNRTTVSSGTSSVSFLDPSGLYGFLVLSAAGLAVRPGSGVVAVTTADVRVNLTFVSTFTYAERFVEVGLPANTPWQVEVGATIGVSSSPLLTLELANGSYPYLATASDYLPIARTLNVTGEEDVVNLTFAGMNATLLGRITPASAVLFVDGSAVDLSAGAFSVSVRPGLHLFEVGAAGYLTRFENVSAGPNATVEVDLTLSPVPGGAHGGSGNGSTGPSAVLLWAVVGGLVVVAIAIVLAALLVRSTPPARPPGAVRSWEETREDAAPSPPAAGPPRP